MAVNLGLDVTQVGYDPTTNSSKVIVTVTANYTNGSYNGCSPSGQIIVDGDAIDFSSNFNYNGDGATSSSGSTIIAQKEVYIGHNSDGSKTLDVSASFDTGISSGTISASTSKELASPNYGEGSGGGDSGDTDSGSDGYVDVDDYPDKLITCQIFIEPDEHSRIYVYDDQTGRQLHSGDMVEQLNTSPWVTVFYEVDEGYDIVKHNCGYYSGNSIRTPNCDGYTFYTVTSGPRKVHISKDSVCDVSVYRVNPLSENYEDYNVYDGDTVYDGEILHLVYTKPKNYAIIESTVNGKKFLCNDYLTVDGDVYISVKSIKYFEEVDLWQSYSDISIGATGGSWIMKWGSYYKQGVSYVGYRSGTDYYTSIIKFTTPSSVYKPKEIKVFLNVDADYVDNFGSYYYALFTSDKNKDLYLNATNIPLDSYQISTGEINKPSFTIYNSNIEPNQTYYLYIMSKGTAGGTIVFSADIIFDANSDVVFIEDKNMLIPHVVCIDNGVTFDKYTPYITVRNLDTSNYLFKAKVTRPGGVRLFSSLNDDTQILDTIPYGIEVTITDIKALWSEDDFLAIIVLKTSYNNKTGWCCLSYGEEESLSDIEKIFPYFDFTVECTVNKNGGIYLYDPVWENIIGHFIQNNTRLRIKSSIISWVNDLGPASDIDYSISPAFVGYRGVLYATVVIEDEQGESITELVELNDVYIQSEHPELEWKRIGI